MRQFRVVVNGREYCVEVDEMNKLDSVMSDMEEKYESYDLFTDISEVEKSKKVESTVIEIHGKFGKNALLRAADLQEGSTTKQRNKLTGGHNSE